MEPLDFLGYTEEYLLEVSNLTEELGTQRKFLEEYQRDLVGFLKTFEKLTSEEFLTPGEQRLLVKKIETQMCEYTSKHARLRVDQESLNVPYYQGPYEFKDKSITVDFDKMLVEENRRLQVEVDHLASSWRELESLYEKYSGELTRFLEQSQAKLKEIIKWTQEPFDKLDDAMWEKERMLDFQKNRLQDFLKEPRGYLEVRARDTAWYGEQRRLIGRLVDEFEEGILPKIYAQRKDESQGLWEALELWMPKVLLEMIESYI